MISVCIYVRLIGTGWGVQGLGGLFNFITSIKLPVIGKPGPFQIIEADGSGEVENPIDAPRRRYDCQNYETCLDVAAALNWDNFTCRGCSGVIEEALFWRARQAMKKDNVVSRLCELPSIKFHKSDDPDEKDRKAG